MLFCGIDLHSNNCFIETIDHEDKVIYSKRHPNVLEEICVVLKQRLATTCEPDKGLDNEPPDLIGRRLYAITSSL